MKIIDVDWIETKAQADAVNKWVLDSCSILRNDENKKVQPNEAIYFFSSKFKDKEVCQEKGLFFVGNYWKEKTIGTVLLKMINEISEFKVKNKMKPILKFEGKSPVFVLTNRELDTIETLNAIPVLPIMLGVN